MPATTFSKAFEHFGASLRNPRWSYSATASDGCIVVSCWDHMLKPYGNNSFVYRVDFQSWTANPLGRKLLLEHIRKAFDQKLSVRAVVAEAAKPKPVVAGRNCSKLKKTFHARDDLIGKVVELDHAHFVIKFSLSNLGDPR